MAELEKIIKGLETCIKAENGGFVCLACNYNYDHEGGCEAQLLQDALDLLKAQQPRVIKISELTSGEPMLVWLEYIDKKETVAGMIFDYVPGRLGFKLIDLTSMDRIYPRIDEYLTRWRCWTSRPDEKRRAEMPWDAT